MRCAALILLAGLASYPTQLPAQSTDFSDLSPSMERTSYRTCNDRPPRPNWIETVDPKEAHKGLLVQEMYRAQGNQAVVEAGECACDIRFPSWDKVNQEFRSEYAALDRWQINELTSQYTRAANEARQSAQPICEAQGNW